jgi:hypothetical protein
MCDKPSYPRNIGGSGRRNFLGAVGAAAALGLVGGSLFTPSAAPMP